MSATAATTLVIHCAKCDHAYEVERSRLFAGTGYLACPNCTPPPPDADDGPPAADAGMQADAG